MVVREFINLQKEIKMEAQLKELLKLLDSKHDNDELSQYEDGIRDMLDAIVSQDGYRIDELIEEVAGE